MFMLGKRADNQPSNPALQSSPGSEGIVDVAAACEVDSRSQQTTQLPSFLEIAALKQ
jgi:hypothetical protein